MGINLAGGMNRIGEEKIRFASAVNLLQNPKPVLLNSDMDETMVQWVNDHKNHNEVALKGNQEAINRHRPHLSVLLNTGRGMTSVKQAAPHLKGLSVDYLALNNGQELYVNHTQRSADQWIAGLSREDQDPVWQNYLKTKGWDYALFRETLVNFMKAEGFVWAHPGAYDTREEGGQFKDQFSFVKKLPDGSAVLFNCYRDQPVVAVTGFKPGYDALVARGEVPKPSYGKGHERYILDFSERLLKLLEAQKGMKITPKYLPVRWLDSEYRICAFLPEGLSKANVVDELLKRYFVKPKAVISAGDHEYNDAQMVKRRRYKANSPLSKIGVRHIPNYSIVSGDRPGIHKVVEGHPRVLKVPEAHLYSALDGHMSTILNQGKSSSARSPFKLDRQA